jgi:hypothetical protein
MTRIPSSLLLVVFSLGCLALVAGCSDGASPCDGDARLVEGECLTEPPACGTPSPVPNCHNLLEGADCLAAGGEEPPAMYISAGTCLCPAGDDGCLCWDSAHCQGYCVSATYDPCPAEQLGTCSPYANTPLGSVCYHFDGQFRQMNND